MIHCWPIRAGRPGRAWLAAFSHVSLVGRMSGAGVDAPEHCLNA
ncbi:hypothetical protein AMP9_0971 [plant metagenome]|uniref:Uncharacterized protein n=1 Tax=plant metagenome TaxID=1297885 RepID=A0A484NQH5_9ZZZZ